MSRASLACHADGLAEALTSAGACVHTRTAGPASRDTGVGWAAWNADNPLHPKGADGKWTNGPAAAIVRPVRDIATLVGDVVPRVSDVDEDRFEAYDLPENAVSDVVDVFTFQYAGLSTSDIEVKPSFDEYDDGLWVSGNIVDQSGIGVGKFARKLYYDPASDRLRARHETLALTDPSLQGQGFAEAFNARLSEWYVRSNVHQVELTANIDIGGYAWARAGYDWADSHSARVIHNRLNQVMRDGDPRIPAERRPEQLELADDMDDRFFDAFRGHPESLPTPFEVSQLGRWPGAGRDDWWIGKAAMIGSEWEAVMAP